MAGKGIIKWRQGDSDALNEAVERFNRKILNISKQAPELLPVQPALVDAELLTEKLQQYPRRELERTIKKMERYLKAGAELPYRTESGVLTTQWEKKEADIAIRALNARRLNERKKFNPTPETGTMFTVEGGNLRPRKNNTESISRGNWDKFLYNLERQLLNENLSLKEEQYKTNFLRKIAGSVGSNSQIYEKVSRIPASELYKFYYTSPIVNIRFIYDIEIRGEIEQEMLNELERLGY